MTKRFTFGTAGIAIAASLMGTAHAQEAAGVYGPVAAEADQVIVVAETEETDRSVAIDADGVELRDAVDLTAGYPMDLLALDAELAALTAPIAHDAQVSGATITAAAPAAQFVNVSTGVVTPQSVNPNYGHINPFYGNINPFYGDIDAFWGNINPFYGDIDAFWGNINPFYGNINPFYGDIDAFWGNINPFYGNINPFYGNIVAFNNSSEISAFWKDSGNQIVTTENNWASLRYSVTSTGDIAINFDGTPDRIRNSLEALISKAEAKFGAAYQSKTGKNFRDGFVAAILAKHGLDLANNKTSKKSLAKTEAERAAFYLDWHDSLMQYSGVDQVDHWMAAINWTPSVTQIQGSGSDTIIGIVDGSFSSDTKLYDNVVWAGGNSNALSGHGAGVTSLIAAKHDGVGVMGIAPNVKIATYNPFGADGTADWDDVRRAIKELEYAYIGGNDTGYVSVINLSLGEKGWTLSQGLADVFKDPSIAPWNKETLFVAAAGNDGISQSADIDWSFANEASIIVVGSINPRGEISSFSNRPGDACLLNNGQCQAGNELYRRFIVAPGELLLVSDGQGGVVRRSGTSFAAPLVSGAISLLHDRWKWLARKPKETAEIIFRSARDLGAPGPDEVYGWGLLDVTASQSPLDFNSMRYFTYKKNWLGIYTKTSVSATSLIGSVPSWWETDDVFFTMFEDIGTTYRDFAVPMSAFTHGKSTNALGRTERLQDFISSRFANWINSGGSDRNGDGKAGFSEVRSNGRQINGEWSLRYDAIVPTVSPEGTWQPTHGAATLTNPNGTMSFTVGHGQGAMALGGYRFGIMSDHDPFTGGVNPVLGFASGETFAGARFEIAKGTSVKVGYTENREEWDEVTGVTPEELMNRRSLGDRPATAMTLDVEQKVSDKVSVGVNYTRLRETNALLGSQTSSVALLGNGSQTEAMTVSASFDVGDGFTFDISATGGRTETARDQILSNSGDIFSTAGQFTATKRGVFNGKDSLRLSVAQPLQVEHGTLELRSDEVIDRDTGAVGEVVQTFDIDTKRRITGEAVYALPLTKSSEFGVFGRYVSEGNPGDDESFVVGGNYTLRF